jgi:hypothetical protein
MLSKYKGCQMSALDVRRERVVVETDRYRVEGDIALSQEGYGVDLADFLNRRNQEFVVIVNSELNALDGSGRNWSAAVIMLARKYIKKIVSLGSAGCH